jgi:hypothetical protein
MFLVTLLNPELRTKAVYAGFGDAYAGEMVVLELVPTKWCTNVPPAVVQESKASPFESKAQETARQLATELKPIQKEKMSCKEPLGIFSQASFEVPPNLPYFWK